MILIRDKFVLNAGIYYLNNSTIFRRRFIVYEAPSAGQCYSFPANLTDIGADRVNAIKDKCAAAKKGSCMCISKRLLLRDMGILLQNIRRIGHMTIQSVDKKLLKIIKLKRRAMLQGLNVMKHRVAYRRSVIKHRLKKIFETCQRTATHTVQQWINAKKPALYKRLKNPNLSNKRKRKIRSVFVSKLRNRELRERIMAVLDARYVRTISALYLNKFNQKINARITATRAIYMRLVRRTRRIFGKFRREVAFKIRKDIKKLRARAHAYMRYISLLDQKPEFDINALVNMTMLQQSYKSKETDVMSKFSWFNPSTLQYPTFNVTNEYRILNRGMTEIFAQVVQTRKERYATFKEKHNLLKLYANIRSKLHQFDSKFSDYVRGANVMPIPLVTKKYGFHYPRGAKPVVKK